MASWISCSTNIVEGQRCQSFVDQWWTKRACSWWYAGSNMKAVFWSVTVSVCWWGPHLFGHGGGTQLVASLRRTSRPLQGRGQYLVEIELFYQSPAGNVSDPNDHQQKYDPFGYMYTAYVWACPASNWILHFFLLKLWCYGLLWYVVVYASRSHVPIWKIQTGISSYEGPDPYGTHEIIPTGLTFDFYMQYTAV
jgi:hypothetical protein